MPSFCDIIEATQDHEVMKRLAGGDLPASDTFAGSLNG